MHFTSETVIEIEKLDETIEYIYIHGWFLVNFITFSIIKIIKFNGGFRLNKNF